MAKRLLSERLMSQKVELGNSVTSACVVNYNPNTLIYRGGFLKGGAKPTTTLIYCGGFLKASDYNYCDFLMT